MLESIIEFIVGAVSSLGYLGIVIMMFLESSFFPFPSEVVMVPAGYLASKEEMNLYLVIFCGILGSLLGAFLNYFLGSLLGRAFVITYGKYFFLKEESFKKVEDFFTNHGGISTFSGRLIPVIRQYISFPAGMTKMNFFTFTLFTALGSAIWVTILALLGYFLGDNEELVREYLHIIIPSLLTFLVIIIFIYIKKQKKEVQ